MIIHMIHWWKRKKNPEDVACNEEEKEIYIFRNFLSCLITFVFPLMMILFHSLGSCH